MPHWAELDDNNVVLRVIVCDADDGADGTKHPPAFCTETLGGTWVRTYYATDGHQFAGIGYIWDPQAANFVVPLPPDDLAAQVADLRKLVDPAKLAAYDDAQAATAKEQP